MPNSKGWFVQLAPNFLDDCDKAMCEMQNTALEKAGLAFDHITPVEANARLARIFAGEFDDPSWVLYRAPDAGVRETFDLLGIPCVNSYRTVFICRDKFLNAALCRKLSVPHPLTYRVPTLSDISEQKDAIIVEIETTFSYPLVVKRSSGQGGDGVFLIHNREELLEAIPTVKPNVIVQEFIDSSPGKDYRVFVVDGKISSAYMRYNDGDFKSNLCSGGHRMLYSPTSEEIDIACKIGRALPLSSISVDFMHGKNGEPIVCEMNSNPNFGRQCNDGFDGNVIADAIALMMKKIACD